MNINCDEVKKYILNHVERNHLRTGDRLPSLRAIAKKSGASMPTVQRAIAVLVNEGILESRIGSGTYLADDAVPGSKLIGLLAPYVEERSGDFLADSLMAIRQTLQKAGFFPVELNSSYHFSDSANENIALIKRFIGLNVSGILLEMCEDAESPFWSFLRKSELPAVCVNNTDAYGDLNSVTADNRAVGSIAAEYFLDKRHRKLSVVTAGCENCTSELERVAGFKESCSGVGAECDVIRLDELCRADGEIDSAKLLERCDGRSGVFCVNDGVAVKIMNAFEDTGRRVPEDVSIIGVDNSVLCEHVRPKLTSVDQFSWRMGERAAELIIDIVNGKTDRSEITNVRIAPSLVERDSVGEREE